MGHVHSILCRLLYVVSQNIWWEEWFSEFGKRIGGRYFFEVVASKYSSSSITILWCACMFFLEWKYCWSFGALCFAPSNEYKKLCMLLSWSAFKAYLTSMFMADDGRDIPSSFCVKFVHASNGSSSCRFCLSWRFVFSIEYCFLFSFVVCCASFVLAELVLEILGIDVWLCMF